VHLKHIARFPQVFRIPLRPIPNLTPCPVARKPISVVILVDRLRKRRVMMEVSVSNVRDGMLKRRLTLAVIVKGRHA
jgi:hypothetical protein